MERVADYVKAYSAMPVHVFSADWCAAIGRDIGLNQPNREWASIGVLTIGTLIEISTDELYIHGFDLLTEPAISAHYFNRRPKDGKYHNVEKERKYIQNLLAAGKIHLFHPSEGLTGGQSQV